MKKQHVKAFLHRGLLFAGFGPVIIGIVYFVTGLATGDTATTTTNMFIATISSYCLAFLAAGCSVFYQIESWGLAKASFLHGLSLYVTYLGCYLLNSWIAADLITIGIFSAIFILGYLAIWVTVLICVSTTAKKLNRKIGKV